MVILMSNFNSPHFRFVLLFVLSMLSITACKESFQEEQEETIVFSQAMMENTVFSTGNPFMASTHNGMFGPDQQLRMIRELVAALNLTDEQKTTTRTLTLTMVSRLMEIRVAFRAQEITREQAVEQIRQARQTFMRSFTAILTPAQAEALERWKQRQWNP
jgi:Spy/CpxP family protein refolding chaperone